MRFHPKMESASTRSFHVCQAAHRDGESGYSIRRAIVDSSFGRTVGRVHGHSAMQIPHDAASAKYGMHLSKFTYQRSTPRTICLFSPIALGRQALVQTWYVEQNSSAPNRIGEVATRGMSVVTPAKRTPAPYFGLISEPCFPSSPSPDAMAGGMSRSAPADGPG